MARHSDLELTGKSAGISVGAYSRGELELILTVDENEGSVWISREFWEAVANRAGWLGGTHGS